MNATQIREVTSEDNDGIAKVVRKVLEELGAPKVGTAYADAALNDMYAHYDAPKKKYFVVEADCKILGGAGIAPLESCEKPICELQKMYFLPEARGRGLGAELIQVCLKQAQDFGFELCYIETMPYMQAAQKLYAKNGFEYIDAPLGNTGHNACSVYMLKKL